MQLIKQQISPLLRLAIPLIITGLAHSAVFFLQTLFLAQLGPDILAAGALVSWFFATFAVILFGTLSSINVLVAHKFGAKDYYGISEVIRDGVWLALIFVIPAFFLFRNISPIFLLFGQSPGIVVHADSYLHALSWGFLPDFVMIALVELLIGIGRTRLSLIVSTVTVSLSIFFCYALILGRLGFPSLGIDGAGWGMSISYWITAILFCTYLVCKKEYRGYLRLLFTRTQQSYLLKLLKIGVPMGMMYCAEVGFFFALSLVMGSLGSQLLAANQVAMQYLSALMSVVFSIAQAITVRMGHLLGAHDAGSAKYAGYVGICLSISIMLVVFIIFHFFSMALIGIDFDVQKPENSEIVRYAAQFLAVGSVFQIIEATRISLFGALRSLHDTHFTLLVSILSFWGIALPVGYLLATRLGFGGQGLWWGMVLGASFSVIVLFWRFHACLNSKYNLKQHGVC